MVKKRFLIAAIQIPLGLYGHARSPFRTPDPLQPRICVQWQDGGPKYVHSDSHIEAYPTFLWDIGEIDQNLLPTDPISHRNESPKTSNGRELAQLIEGLLEEISQGRRRNFTHFTLIQKKNFNHRRRCGLIVLKFKEHPFVVKLFMENPQTFVNPYCKGIEPISFFFMAGGANRHLSGLTRIKNAQVAQKKIAGLDRWRNAANVPRKWFWVPKNNQKLHITGWNVGGMKKTVTNIPGSYAIVADFIEQDSSFQIKRRAKHRLAMLLCNDLDLCIDPHGDNFVFVRDQTSGRTKVTIIDTEHFPTIVGLKNRRSFRTHRHWIAFLIGKYFDNSYWRTKSRRRADQLMRRELDIL